MAKPGAARHCRSDTAALFWKLVFALLVIATVATLLCFWVASWGPLRMS